IGGKSIEPYFESIQYMGDELPDTPMIESYEYSFPVQSAIKPGVIEKERVVSLSALQPLFLIGNDDFSKEWLVENKRYLFDINAIVFVVNVERQEHFEHLKTLALEVTLIPIPADDLADRLNITAYPVIITENRIFQ